MAAEEYTVHEVRLQRRTYPTPDSVPDRVVDRWHVGLTRPDGVQGVHIIPAEAFADRAAVYDLDPADVDTLLDILLHEPYMPPQETPGRPPAETVLVATADGLEEPAQLLRGSAHEEPVTVFNAPTVAHAREAHLTRVEQAKQRVRIVPPRPAKQAAGRRAASATVDPLDVIRQRVRIDPEDLAARRQMVEQARRDHADKTTSAKRGRLRLATAGNSTTDVPPVANDAASRT